MIGGAEKKLEYIGLKTCGENSYLTFLGVLGSMGDQDKSLQEVSYEISTPNPTSLEKAVKDTSLPVSKLRGTKYAIQVMNHINSKGVIDVTFKVPAAINEGLKTGKYIRRGGVIVQKDSKQFVYFLKEGKKLTKLGNALFQVTDIFSEIALNEKLKQIQVQLDEIADYVKARHNALIPSANEALRHAFLSQDQNERRRFLLAAEKDFKTAKMEMEQFVRTRVQKNHEELIKFESARIYNTKNATAISNNLNELMAFARGIAFCTQAQIGINEYLTNTEVSLDLRTNLTDFLSAIGEYVEFFIGQENDYDKLLLLKLYLDPNKDSDMNFKGDLDNRLKKLSNVPHDLYRIIKEDFENPQKTAEFAPGLYKEQGVSGGKSTSATIKKLIKRFDRAHSGGSANLKKNDEGIIKKNVDGSLHDSIKIELASHADDLFIASGLKPEND